MKTISVYLLVVCTLILGGCSRFNGEWRQAVRQPIPANDIRGPWEGSWISTANGHNGALRCLISKVDEENYDARFRAAYKKWFTFHFGYTVRLQAKTNNTRVDFRGAEDLGALAGGVYVYEGHADPTNFFSSFKSKYDHGTFQMKRPPAQGTIPVYSTPERR